MTREKGEESKCQCKNNLHWAYSICHLEILRVCRQFGSWLKVQECESGSDRAFHSKMSRRPPFLRQVQWADRRENISSRKNTTQFFEKSIETWSMSFASHWATDAIKLKSIPAKIRRNTASYTNLCAEFAGSSFFLHQHRGPQSSFHADRLLGIEETGLVETPIKAESSGAITSAWCTTEIGVNTSYRLSRM